MSGVVGVACGIVGVVDVDVDGELDVFKSVDFLENISHRIVELGNNKLGTNKTTPMMTNMVNNTLRCEVPL